ncbi:hypothetical protein BMG03_04735 [Thioclava nitratireducens]|uniref:Acyltransferase n=2 Tax=Thioclava nitratireducens TaxID=1915078 RepID=A0ABN4XAP2_9RHOB|nr:hypothetical protein BMG03_04735 [Thioclava nitratireducens]
MWLRLRKILKRIVISNRSILKLFFSAFFDRRFLSGRYFDEQLIGYFWAANAVWTRNILRLAAPLPFPTGFRTHVSNPRNIHFHPDDLNNLQSPGTYFQNFAGQIYLGKGCFIGPNVGIITANHDPSSLDEHLCAKDVRIGADSWIGMNAIILPGVTLGPRTIVAAGAIVTKAVPEGNCVLAGNPAKKIRNLGSEMTNLQRQAD